MSCEPPGPPCRQSSDSRPGSSAAPKTRYEVSNSRNGSRPCKGASLGGPAPEPPARARDLRALAERASARDEIIRCQARQRHRVEPPELGTRGAGKAQRLRVQRLLEDRARVPRVAEAPPPLSPLEDAPQLGLGP